MTEKEITLYFSGFTLFACLWALMWAFGLLVALVAFSLAMMGFAVGVLTMVTLAEMDGRHD